jgi:hypothetical protein
VQARHQQVRPFATRAHRRAGVDADDAHRALRRSETETRVRVPPPRPP